MIPTIEQVKEAARQFATNATLANPDEKALHIYRDADGNLLYCRIRLKNITAGEKWIRPFYHDGLQFVMGEPPAPANGKPLYNLHMLAQDPAALVWIVEGEKAADAMNKAFKAWGKEYKAWGVEHQNVATTSGGAQSSHTVDWTPLAERRIVIWPDNDEPGAKYATDVADKLQNIAASIVVLDSSGMGLTDHGDAWDWLRRPDASLDTLLLLLDRNREIGTETAEAVGSVLSPSNIAGDAIPQPENAAMHDTHPAQSDDEKIKWLASLKPLEYARVRKEQAKLMRVSATELGALVKEARKEREADGISFADCEPWHEPIKPDALLSELSDTVRRFIVCSHETADAAALWAAMTWFIDVVQVAPLAVITAPEKRCGKSQLLFLLGRISCRPLTASNISPAALFRVIDAWQPTLLVDEVDAFMRENEELRGLLNCGHTRDGAYTVRIVGEAMTPTRFNTWGAKALAGIGHLADTLMDRAVTLELRRKLGSENVERLRHAEPSLFETLAAKLARFAEDGRDDVRVARPELPASLHDRAQDNWEPLLAIAQVAGGDWPDRARAAALRLSGNESATVAVGTELLADVQEIFEHKHEDKISTADLIFALCEDGEKSWATYNRGKPLSPRQLAKRLSEYGIFSKTVRLGYANTPKGYLRSDLEEAFARYLSTPPENGTFAATPPQPNKHVALSVADNPPQNLSATQSATLQPSPDKACGVVADKKPILEGGEEKSPDPSHLRI